MRFLCLAVFLAFFAIPCFAAETTTTTTDLPSLLTKAEQGDAKAQTALGELYRDGRGVKQDWDEAIKWWHRAAEQGDRGAQFNLGSFYYVGYNGRRDDAEAAKWYGRAAEQGDVQAQFILAMLLQHKQDYMGAARWFRRAAEQQDGRAQYWLGDLYYTGQPGVPQDIAEATKWLRKAAEQGYSSAQYELGKIYYNGIGMTQNYEEAYFWLVLAAASASDAKLSQDSAAVRDKIAGLLPPQQVSEIQKRAAEWKQPK
jgi:hypothetical protein